MFKGGGSPSRMLIFKGALLSLRKDIKFALNDGKTSRNSNKSYNLHNTYTNSNIIKPFFFALKSLHNLLHNLVVYESFLKA